MARADPDLSILDLGCGGGHQITPLLERNPHVRYVGVEPNPAAAATARTVLAGFDIEIVNAPAYDIDRPADVILSFSVLEHVYQRDRYIAAIARNLRRLAFINYDAGHFQRSNPLKAIVRRALARAGHEAHYERFVSDAEFLSLVSAHNLTIDDAKMFNSLKPIYHELPQQRRAEFMHRWLEFELYLNEVIEYRDELAPLFGTRNFVLTNAA